ncbi:Putative HotDog domain superfamily protein [Septoria linicola]|uniref:HotDog domain superfamily protein n=1 Tax=Septoria linicola TaxID=215465 RepID=A0A9Q9B758_9PEZI|nr:Putative HotDog domain superfamily protein [Septoria linicola]
MRVGSRPALSSARQILYAPTKLAICQRHQSTASPATTPATEQLSPRWLSDVKKRLGHCLTWGLQPDQTQEAGQILKEISSDWRELVAGSEGFLTSKQRRSTFRQQVVWGEQDSMGHVNNVVYNRYAETGRVDYFRKFATYIDPAHAKEWNSILTPQGDGLLLRKITTEFKFPMRYPDHVTIYHKLSTEPVEGTDTFIMDAIILSELHQRPAARCIEDCVLYDYRTAKKRPLLPYMLPVLRRTWELQEEAKRVNSQRVLSLLERVRKLEKASWDREGAVEDMGSAGS